MIFISYSPEDSKALQQLQDFLKPLQRSDAGFVCWDDTELSAGDVREDEIEQAITKAATAILLVSSSYLASDEIFEQQLSPIMQRTQSGELRLIPMYIGFANLVGTTSSLSDYRGYGSPQEPLNTWSKRQKAFQQMTEQLSKLQPAAPAVKAKTKITATTVVQHSQRQHTLNVHLQSSGNRLKIDYYPPDHSSIATQTRRWDDIEQIDTSTDKAYGNALFKLIFGEEKDWEPIFRQLFHQPAPRARPNPIRGAVRLRICSSEPLLLSLPWRLMRWQDHLLTDKRWQFSSAHVLDPNTDYTTSAPCNIVVVAPQAELERGARDPDHADMIAQTLKQIWPGSDEKQGYLKIVHTQQQLNHALHSMRPHILYIYAQADIDKDRLCLCLDAEDHSARLFSIDQLARWCEQLNPAPALIYLNLTGLETDNLILLNTSTPLLIWRRESVTSREADRQVLQWLHQWLQQGDDPLSALHKTLPDDSTHSLFIHSNYRDWKTHVYRDLPRQQLLHLALDRDAQKALVAKHLRDLARSETRRVMTLVAYADSGNMLEELSEQLQYHLDLDGADAVEIDRKRLQFPESRDNLQHDLEAELSLQLQQNPDETVPFLLRRHAPRVTGSGKRAVLWLDWGLFRQNDQQNWLKPSELESWLRFTSVYLSRHCPEDIRLVCMLTMELDADKHQGLAQRFDQYSQRDWCLRQEFWFTVLPPLGSVPYYELFNFLRDHSSCDPDIRAEIARRLHDKTAGEFEPTHVLMQQAEHSTWYDLLNQLRQEQGETLVEDEDEF